MTSSNKNTFRAIGPLWGESTGHQCIPLTEASDAELWYFSSSAPCKNGANNRDAGDLRPLRSLWRQCIGYSLSRWIDNDVHWKYITLYEQMMIIMKMTMMIMMIIMWGLYIYNLISHMYIWYSKCQNVTHLKGNLSTTISACGVLNNFYRSKVPSWHVRTFYSALQRWMSCERHYRDLAHVACYKIHRIFSF